MTNKTQNILLTIRANVLLFLMVFFCMYYLSSCINSEQYEQLKKDFRDVEYDSNFDTFDSIYTEIPEYSVLCNTINSLHAPFDKSLLLDVRSADLYQNSKETSIAFGMYIADLGYARHYERVQLCMDYMEAVKTLAEKLAIRNKEFNETVPLIEANLGNKEVLFSVTDSLLNAGNIVLSDNEKYGISALVLGGLWVESAYIGLNLSDGSQNSDALAALESHFEILSQINKLFACLDDKSVISDFKNSLSDIEKKGPQNENLSEDIENLRDLYIK